MRPRIVKREEISNDEYDKGLKKYNSCNCCGNNEDEFYVEVGEKDWYYSRTRYSM